MPPLSLLIKPASSSCNLHCRYCFYHSIAQNRMIENYGIMKIDLLETIVKKALQYAEYQCTFAFQGGEPTLAGLDFYRKLIEFQHKYNEKRITIINAIQTNGTTIDKEWAKFLAENNILVGLSLDGPKDIHDALRIDSKGHGTFDNIMKTVELFNTHKVEYNILSVANGYSARHAVKIYNFFRKNNFRYLQFIPCLDPLDVEHGSYEYSLIPAKFTVFLKDMFDLWYKDVKNSKSISIRYFDNLVSMVMGYRAESCGMIGSCQCQFVIEADGGVYPCDFYVTDSRLIGRIDKEEFHDILHSEKTAEFIEQSMHISDECRVCRWADLCRGGCRRNREPFKDGKPGLNYYCAAYKEFFEYAFPRIKEIASLI